MGVIEILVIGNNKPIMETIARLINKDGKWLATIAFSVDEAIQICLQKEFGLALIGAGLSAEQERSLTQKLKQRWPKLPIVKHYGGGSGLLYAEIYQGLQSY
jgi:DNA-binding NtrC family response regulator